MVGGLVWVMKS